MVDVLRLGFIEAAGLTEYERHLRFERQLAPTTIHNYLAYVTRLKDFTHADMVATRREDIRDFLATLEQSGISKAGVANYVIALRCYFNWLADMSRDPSVIQLSFFLLKIVKIKREWKIPVVPTQEEIIQLRRTFENFKKAAAYAPQMIIYQKLLREIAAIELLITTGIRSNELRNLRYCDVDLEKQLVYIRKGKGDKQRVSLFNGTAHAALSEYFAHIKTDPEELLFPYKQGNLINYLIKRWAKQANINPRIHAHSFRHYFITEAQRQGVDIEIVAEQVGHVNIDTTRHYTHFSPEYLRSRFQGCHI